MDTVDGTEEADGTADDTAERGGMSPFTSWLCFGAGVSILPLAIRSWELYQNDRPYGFEPVLSTGELLLISVVLLAGSYGEFLRGYSCGTKKWRGGHTAVTVAAVAMLMVTCYGYGSVSSKTAADFEHAMKEHDPFVPSGKIAAEYSHYLGVVTAWSVVTYLLTVAVGVYTIRLTLKGAK